jgi:hypothetical protein
MIVDVEIRSAQSNSLTGYRAAGVPDRVACCGADSSTIGLSEARA